MKSISNHIFYNGRLLKTVFIVFVMHASVTLVGGQRSTSTEPKKGITVCANDSTYEMILQSIAVTSGVPIGFEQENSSRSEQLKISISVSNIDIEDLMDHLIAKMPDYVWFYDDHVINVLPKSSLGRIPDIALDDISLDVKQGDDLSISLTNSNAIMAAFDQHKSKLISATKPPDGSLNAGSMSIPLRIKPPKNGPIHFKSKSFRALLNEIVRTGYANFWMLAKAKNTSDEILVKFTH